MVSKRSLIIVPVDGSHETEHTVRYALSIAKQRGADLHAVQVVRRNGRLWFAPESEKTLRTRLRALRPAAAHVGVFLRIVTLRGTPERVIPAYAQLVAASLVVVGHHYGSSRLCRNSSVSRRLSRSSPVSVLVVPAGVDAEAQPPNRIVAAVDLTVASAIALRTAAGLSNQHGAHLTILHAMGLPEHMVFSGGEAWRLVQRLPADAELRSEVLKRTARAHGAPNAEPVVATGDAHRLIVDTVTKSAADLIVMGVSPRSWMDEIVSGSTLREVLRHATAPVLVVPVVAGDYEWVDEVQERSGRIPATADGIARRAA
jgi:nucleotide-binding universal stress UspA family protein